MNVQDYYDLEHDGLPEYLTVFLVSKVMCDARLGPLARWRDCPVLWTGQAVPDQHCGMWAAHRGFNCAAAPRQEEAAVDTGRELEGLSAEPIVAAWPLHRCMMDVSGNSN